MNEPVFLRLNGVIVPRATDELYAAMIATAERKMGKPELAALLRRLGQSLTGIPLAARRPTNKQRLGPLGIGLTTDRGGRRGTTNILV